MPVGRRGSASAVPAPPGWGWRESPRRERRTGIPQKDGTKVVRKAEWSRVKCAAMEKTEAGAQDADPKPGE